MAHRSDRTRTWVVAGTVVAAAALHVAVPVGPHAWHWLHLLGGKLYYVPILLAAGWFGARATAWTTVAVTVLSTVHILRGWAGFPMIQAEQAAEIATFWLVAVVSAGLFGRERRALAGVRQAHEETLAALAAPLELRERYTAGHSRRVRDYSLLVARELGWGESSSLEQLARGALLHDIGKIGIPDAILLKQTPLGEEEREFMRRHPEMGASLLGDAGWLRETRELILAHHERYDGTGYPRGLAGEAIPQPARMFAVADAFDALTTDRPYHKALSWQEAAGLIAQARGSQFDPDVADAFLRIPFEEWARVAGADGVRLQRASVRPAAAEEPAVR